MLCSSFSTVDWQFAYQFFAHFTSLQVTFSSISILIIFILLHAAIDCTVYTHLTSARLTVALLKTEFPS